MFIHRPFVIRAALALALAAPPAAEAQAGASLTPMPRAQFFDTAGRPLAGGCFFSYQAGSSTPLATYNNASAAVANPNPTVLDSAGRADIWLAAGIAYRLTVSAKSVAGGCAAGTTTLYTADNVIDQGFALVKSLQAGTFTIGLRATPVTGTGGGVGVGNAVLSATTAGLYVSVNGGAPVLLSGGSGGGSGTPGGAVNTVQYNGGGTLAGSGNFVWTNSTNDLVICPAPATGCTATSGVDAPAFSSSATGTAPAFTTASGNFIVQGNGAGLFQNLTVTTTFNSRADVITATNPNPATTPAIQSSGGNFIIFGDGQAQFQTVRATTTFNSRADVITATNPNPALTAAFQTSGGDFRINGDGRAWFQYVCTQGNPLTGVCTYGLDQNGALTVSSCSGCGGTGSGAAGGPTNSIQYNTGSGLGGSANLIWTNGATQMTICNPPATGCTATSGFQGPSFSSSATGTAPAFVAGNGAGEILGNGDATFQDVTVTKTFNSIATGTTPALTQASGTFEIFGSGDAGFQSVGIGLRATALTGTGGGTGLGNAMLSATTAGLYLSLNGAPPVLLNGTGGGTGTPGAPTNSIQYNNAGTFAGTANFTWNNATNILTVGGSTGGINAYTIASYATGTATAFDVGAFVVNGSGDVTARNLTVSSCTGCGGGNAAGPTGAVQFNSGGAFGGSANFTWNNSSAIATITGGATSGFQAPGFTSSAAGKAVAFTTTGNSFVIAGDGTAAFASLATPGGITVGNGFYGLTGAGALTVSSCSGCPGVPGGPTNAIQYNGGAGFAGTGNFTWNNGTNIMTIGGNSGGVNAWLISSYATGATTAFNSAQNFVVTGAGDVTGHSFKIAGSGVTYEFLGTNFNVQPNGNVSSNGLIAATNLTATTGGLNVGTASGSGGSNFATSGLGAQISKAGVAASASFYDSGGNCTVGTGLGGIGCSSDLRMKQNIVTLTSAMDKILQLRPVTFQWKANRTNAVGFIAQEVQALFPLLIYSDPNDKDKYLSLSEIGMMPYLVKALQELAARVAVLEGRR